MRLTREQALDIEVGAQCWPNDEHAKLVLLFVRDWLDMLDALAGMPCEKGTGPCANWGTFCDCDDGTACSDEESAFGDYGCDGFKGQTDCGTCITCEARAAGGGR